METGTWGEIIKWSDAEILDLVQEEVEAEIEQADVFNKLPQELRLIISREVKGDDWDLNELVKVIEGEIEARERALSITSQVNKGLSRDIPTATNYPSIQ